MVCEVATVHPHECNQTLQSARSFLRSFQQTETLLPWSLWSLSPSPHHPSLPNTGPELCAFLCGGYFEPWSAGLSLVVLQLAREMVLALPSSAFRTLQLSLRPPFPCPHRSLLTGKVKNIPDSNIIVIRHCERSSHLTKKEGGVMVVCT
jgi:hypothetical protein